MNRTILLLAILVVILSSSLASAQEQEFSFNAYVIGDKVTLSDESTHQYYETWDETVELLGMKMPKIFFLHCRKSGACEVRTPNSDVGTMITKRSVLLGIIITVKVIIPAITGGGSGATIKLTPGGGACTPPACGAPGGVG